MRSVDEKQSHSEADDRILIADGHVDLLYHMMRTAPKTPFDRLEEGPLTPASFEVANLSLVVSAFYCADQYNGPETSVKHLQSLFDYSKEMLVSLTPIASRADLETVFEDNQKTGLIYLLENGDALVDEDIQKWQVKGIRAVGLTHAGQNRIGSGNGVKNPSGLTTAGRRLVQALSASSLPIDVAHLSEPCFTDLIKIFNGPLFSSHTGLRRFCDLPRNLSGDQVRYIMAQDGVIGVTVNPEMLSTSQQAGVDDVFRHIDWLVQRFEDRQVAVGSDFGGFEMSCQGLAHPGQFSALTDIMAQNGYPLSAIKNIMGRNWYRFYRPQLPAL